MLNGRWIRLGHRSVQWVLVCTGSVHYGAGQSGTKHFSAATGISSVSNTGRRFGHPNQVLQPQGKWQPWPLLSEAAINEFLRWSTAGMRLGGWLGGTGIADRWPDRSHCHQQSVEPVRIGLQSTTLDRHLGGGSQKLRAHHLWRNLWLFRKTDVIGSAESLERRIPVQCELINDLASRSVPVTNSTPSPPWRTKCPSWPAEAWPKGNCNLLKTFHYEILRITFIICWKTKLQ